MREKGDTILKLRQSKFRRRTTMEARNLNKLWTVERRINVSCCRAANLFPFRHRHLYKKKKEGKERGDLVNKPNHSERSFSKRRSEFHPFDRNFIVPPIPNLQWEKERKRKNRVLTLREIHRAAMRKYSSLILRKYTLATRTSGKRRTEEFPWDRLFLAVSAVRIGGSKKWNWNAFVLASDTHIFVRTNDTLTKSVLC